MQHHPLISNLFPYTTLFRSVEQRELHLAEAGAAEVRPEMRGPEAALLHDRLQGWDQRSADGIRSEEHTSELQSLTNLVCRLLLEKKKTKTKHNSVRKHMLD